MAIDPKDLGGRFVKSGKVKDIYELKDGNLLFHFTDRVSAFDVVLPSKIPRKGEVLCKFGAYWFNHLGVAHHMVKTLGRDMMVVKRLQMIPVECVVRGYLYGSLYERVKKGEVKLPIEPELAAKLPEATFDPTTKYEAKDVPVTSEDILQRGWLTEEELKWVVDTSIKIYEKIAGRARDAGFILADLKLEFGKDEDGEILLADSIGPDEFRLWPVEKYVIGRSQVSFDKQPVRDWLIEVGYKARLDYAVKNGLPIPTPPKLPEELINETTQRYITAYERLTGLSIEAE